MTRAIAFENALDDFITEFLTKEDIPELEKYFEDTTLISIIKENFRFTDDEEETLK